MCMCQRGGYGCFWSQAITAEFTAGNCDELIEHRLESTSYLTTQP